MSNSNSLRLAGRAGRIDHVGKICGGDSVAGICATLAREQIADPVQGQAIHLNGGEAMLQFTAGQQHLHPRVLNYIMKPLNRMFRVERQISSACFQHSKHGNHHFHAALEANAYAVFRLNTALLQEVGKLVGAVLEFRVIQGFSGLGERNVVRMACRLFIEKFMHALIVRINAGCAVPFIYNLLPLFSVQQPYLCNLLKRVSCDLLQKPDEMPAHPLNG